MLDIEVLVNSIESVLSSGVFDAARPLVSLYRDQTHEERYVCKAASIKAISREGFHLENVSFEHTHFICKTPNSDLRVGKFVNCVFSEADVSGCVFDKCTIRVARVSPKDRYWWSDTFGSFDANYCDFNSCMMYPGDGYIRIHNSNVDTMSVSGSQKNSYTRLEKCNMENIVVSNAELSSLLLRGKIKGLTVDGCKIETLDIDSENTRDVIITGSTVKNGKVYLGKTSNFKIQSTSFNSGLFSQNMDEVFVENCPSVIVLHHSESNQYAFVHSLVETQKWDGRNRYMSVCHAGYEFGHGSFMDHMRDHEDRDMAEFFSENISDLFRLSS